MKKLILLFAILSLSMASAANYKIKLFQPATLKGTELKAGEYKIDVVGDKMTILNGKEKIDVPVKVEAASEKFNDTSVRFANENGKMLVRELRLGGTKTKVVIND